MAKHDASQYHSGLIWLSDEGKTAFGDGIQTDPTPERSGNGRFLPLRIWIFRTTTPCGRADRQRTWDRRPVELRTVCAARADRPSFCARSVRRGTRPDPIRRALHG